MSNVEDYEQAQAHAAALKDYLSTQIDDYQSFDEILKKSNEWQLWLALTRYLDPWQ